MFDARQRAFDDFDRLGEDHVRLWVQNFDDAGAGVSRKLRKSWAIQWLAQFERQSRLQNESSQAESPETAKSAKDAAWEALTALPSTAGHPRTSKAWRMPRRTLAGLAGAFSAWRAARTGGELGMFLAVICIPIAMVCYAIVYAWGGRMLI